MILKFINFTGPPTLRPFTCVPAPSETFLNTSSISHFFLSQGRNSMPSVPSSLMIPHSGDSKFLSITTAGSEVLTAAHKGLRSCLKLEMLLQVTSDWSQHCAEVSESSSLLSSVFLRVCLRPCCRSPPPPLPAHPSSQDISHLQSSTLFSNYLPPIKPSCRVSKVEGS